MAVHLVTGHLIMKRIWSCALLIFGVRGRNAQVFLTINHLIINMYAFLLHMLNSSLYKQTGNHYQSTFRLIGKDLYHGTKTVFVIMDIYCLSVSAKQDNLTLKYIDNERSFYCLLNNKPAAQLAL